MNTKLMNKLIFLFTILILIIGCSDSDDEIYNQLIIGKWQNVERGDYDLNKWESSTNIVEEYTKDGRCISVESDGFTATSTYEIIDKQILIYFSDNKNKPSEIKVIHKLDNDELEYTIYYHGEKEGSWRLIRIK